MTTFVGLKYEVYMEFLSKIGKAVVDVLQAEFGLTVDRDSLLFNETRKEFDGDYTLVIFPFIKLAKKSPQVLGDVIGKFCVENVDFIEDFNLIKGFLNFSFSNAFWLDTLVHIEDALNTEMPATGNTILVEFSSPNTNKPLHLGHVRNILLGWATSNILEAAGHKVIKTQIVNDRGVAICKSMLAWQEYGNGDTPESTGIKPDHFVGSFYVLFETKFKAEYQAWQNGNEGEEVYNSLKKDKQEKAEFFKAYKNQYFNKYSKLGANAKSMLIAWEDGNEEVRTLWKKMNSWVYKGFETTYNSLGVTFDSMYYESQTYTLGKDLIEEGLSREVFFRKEDGSVWIDLEDEGMDQKLVLRSDGTSVYMTQDIGTAHRRYEDTNADGMVYVVADEQDYHFKALFCILKKLGEPYSDSLHHLSYGMVDLPSGKMKSREGTVVDADVLIEEVIEEARANAVERGEIEDISQDERDAIYSSIGKAALKFFILKVNPKRRMIFNPAESVDMQGTTGPYVQNAYVRVQSILRKAGDLDLAPAANYKNPEPIELEIIKKLNTYRQSILTAAENYDPSIITVYCYDLARLYHRFYSDVRILGAESVESKAFRVKLGRTMAITIEKGFKLLGINMPDRM